MRTNLRLFSGFLPTLVAACILVFALSSCGSSRRGVKTSGSKPAVTHIAVDSSLPPETQALLAEAQRWLGTAYRYGGTSKQGVDCSGLTLNIFNNALAIKLPRNSAEQQKYCRNINRQELFVGDLLFFATGGSSRVNHVGMYIGDRKMVHASGSKGVIISGIDEAYYTRNYHSSGRVEKYYAMINRKKSKKTNKNELPEIDLTPAETLYASTNPNEAIEAIETANTVANKLEVIATVDANNLDRVLANAARAAINDSTTTITADARQMRESLNLVRRQILDDVLDQIVDSIVSEYFD